MMRTIEAIMDHLAGLGIEAVLHRHAAVFTVEESSALTHHLPGAHTKNLFLEDKAGGLWLVTCLSHQQVKVNALARFLKSPRVSFASAERLMEILGVEPGSVTPLALVNDRAQRVRSVWDSKMLAYDIVNVHPLVNTGTVAMTPADLRRFATASGHTPLEVDLDLALTA